MINDNITTNEKPLDKLVGSYSNTAIFRTMAFIGDSLSSGEFETRDEEGNPKWKDFFEYSWGQYIARKNGLKAYNFSRGGMTTKEYVETFAKERGFLDKDKACQAYVIALGVNDIFGWKMEIGSTADIDINDYTNNKNSFLGYYGRIVSLYKEISPDAKFFFVTLPNEANDSTNEKALRVRDALYSLTEIFDNSYVIDLYEYGPVYDEEFKNKYYLYGHLNASGYILTANLIDSYIDYIVRNNPKDFDYVAFIGAQAK